MHGLSRAPSARPRTAREFADEIARAVELAPRGRVAEYAKKHEIDVLLSGERTDSGDISGIPSAQKIYMSEETEKQMDVFYIRLRFYLGFCLYSTDINIKNYWWC